MTWAKAKARVKGKVKVPAKAKEKARVNTHGHAQCHASIAFRTTMVWSTALNHVSRVPIAEVRTTQLFAPEDQEVLKETA